MTETNDQPSLGRPRLSEDEPTVIVSISMPESYRTWLWQQDRSTSQAIRYLIEAEMERQDKEGAK